MTNGKISKHGKKHMRNASGIDRSIIYGLLDILEVPRVGAFERRGRQRGRNLVRGEKRGGWWVRNRGELDELLHDIEECWRKAIRENHPDNGGNNEDAVAINLAWAKCKRLFANRGVVIN